MRRLYFTLNRWLLSRRIAELSEQKAAILSNIKAARDDLARIEREEATARHNYRSMTL